LGRDAEAFCFSPQEAEAARRARDHEKRVTPLKRGNAPGTNRKQEPKVRPGARYSTGSYRRAVQRACDAAGVERWTPHQLRHSRATELRKSYGIEAARIALGHTNAGVTEIYAEADLETARKIASEVG
jgi:integrase